MMELIAHDEVLIEELAARTSAPTGSGRRSAAKPRAETGNQAEPDVLVEQRRRRRHQTARVSRSCRSTIRSISALWPS